MAHPPLFLVLSKLSMTLVFLLYIIVVDKVFLLIAVFLIVGVYGATEDTQKVGKKPVKSLLTKYLVTVCAPLIHVPGHLVENQPVSLGTTPDEVMNVAVILILAEVSPHFPLDQKITKPEYVKHGYLCSDHKIRKKDHVKSKFAVTIKNYWLR